MSDYETNYKKSYAQDYRQTYGQSQSYGEDYSRYDDEGDTNWSQVIVGSVLIAAGSYLIYRGLSSDEQSGYDGSYDAYAGSQSRGKGVQVRESIVVNRPLEELYRYWRNLENLPRIMSHLESVTEMGSRSHWKAKGPLNTNPEWDAQITDERQNETISWRSLENSQVPNEGTVRFSRRSDSSTEILVSLTYHPPLGPVGATVAKLFGEEPSQQIRDDLENFKQAVESGSLSLTTAGGYGDSGTF